MSLEFAAEKQYDYKAVRPVMLLQAGLGPVGI